MAGAAENLHRGAQSIAGAVADHNESLVSLRSSIQGDRTKAIAALGAAVVITAIVIGFTLFATAGAGAAAVPEEAAGGEAAGAGAITAAAAAIDGDIAASSLIPLLANGARIFGAIGSFTKADAQLLAIEAIVVAAVAGDSADDNTKKRKFEASPKHGPEQRGDAAPEPTHPQETLDESVRIKSTSTRRVGYDPETGEFDVFDETYNDSEIYHGHQRTWDELTQDMKNALIKAGKVNRRGKPIN